MATNKKELVDFVFKMKILKNRILANIRGYTYTYIAPCFLLTELKTLVS